MHVVRGVGVSTWCVNGACEVPVGGEGRVPVWFCRVLWVGVLVGGYGCCFVCLCVCVCGGGGVSTVLALWLCGALQASPGTWRVM